MRWVLENELTIRFERTQISHEARSYMKKFSSEIRAFTLIELLVVMAIIAILAAMLLPVTARSNGRSLRVQCVNNQKQIGVAFRVWESDNGDKYPMAITSLQGGASEYVSHTTGGVGAGPINNTAAPGIAAVFQVMSNELSTPKVVICPADTSHTTVATNFGTYGVAAGDFTSLGAATCRISYFITGDATEVDSQLTLVGDCNLVSAPGGGGSSTPALTRFLVQYALGGTFNSTTVAWTIATHNKVGNVALADGSVSEASIGGVRTIFQNSTNTVVYPVSNFIP